MNDIPEFDSFSYDDAWRLGVDFADECRSAGLPMAFAIDLSEHRVFQAGLPGSTAMNARWADRKANIVRHFDLPSAEVFERYGGMADFYTVFALDRNRFAAAEGAIPIRVQGSLVGVLAVSGLDAGGDHELALSALVRYRARQDRP